MLQDTRGAMPHHLDGATEKIVEDKEEENSDAIRTSKADLEDDGPDV